MEVEVSTNVESTDVVKSTDIVEFTDVSGSSGGTLNLLEHERFVVWSLVVSREVV